MSGRLALGFDVGTQGTKGLVFDVEGSEVVARAGRSYDLLTGLAPGAAEQHPDTWVQAVRDVARELLRTPGVRREEVSCVGVSGQQHGFVALDDEGKVVRPAKLWCDTETAPEARELSAELGRAVPTGFTASKVRWLAKHEPENWARTRTTLLPHDYLNFLLTGRRTAEAGDASGTGWFDPRERTWDADAVRRIDPRLAETLPELLPAGEPAGELSEQGAELLGLSPGTLVGAGGGDNMMSAVGSGATRPGVVTVSLGTSGTVFTHCTAPAVDEAGLIAPFCDSVGGWLPLLCVMNLTGVTEEVRAAFDRDHDELTALAREEARGCDGLLWLPFLQGERVPDLPDATGTLLGMRPGHLRPGLMYRAAIEGPALNLAWGVERMRAMDIEPQEVRLVGGAARNPLWRRILADALACDVVPLEELESAALGAALQARWILERRERPDLTADAVVSPHVRLTGERTRPEAEGVAAYRELGERFRREVSARY